MPSSRIEMPVMLRSSPMDRGGLHTWLATRKAESDKKREEEVSLIFILTHSKMETMVMLEKYGRITFLRHEIEKGLIAV